MKKENNDNTSRNTQIEEFLSDRYEFRYNTVLNRAEYRLRGTGDYTAIDRYRINTLKRALDKEAGVQTSPENLYSIIESDFSPRINPVQAYFHSLPIMEEAKTLLNEGFRYWFNDEEIIELHRNSEVFQVYTTEMELLLRYFTFPTEAEKSTKRFYMTNSEIVGYLSCYTRQSLSAKRMGEALRKAGYARECRRVNGNPVYVYAVRKIFPEQPP